MTDFTSFPIPAKKISELSTISSASGNELIPLVSSSTTKIITANNLLKKYKADNVVLVKTEADFGTAVAGQITLQNNTTYAIGVNQLLVSSELIIPARGNVQIIGNGINISNLIFIGSAKILFRAASLSRLHIKQMNVIDGVGNNTLFNCEGHPTLGLPAEIVSDFCIFYGWASRGTAKNLTLVDFDQSEHYNCGAMTLDNLFALTMTNYVSYNFFPNSQGYHFKIINNISQANINACAFVSAKNESILYVDPAISADSGISIGTSAPYQGYVIGSIVSYVNIGGGKVRVICANGHSFDNGDNVLTRFSTNYNGVFAVSNVVKFDPVNLWGTFDITATFVADDAKGQAILLSGASPKIENFFKSGTSGTITAYASNGAGGTRITSNAHGLSNDQSLYISGDNSGNYDGGYVIFGVTTNTFDIAKTFVANDAQGSWSTASLNQTSNVIETTSTGGIIPNSQSVLDANNTTALLSQVLTTTIQQIIWTTGWNNNVSEKFKLFKNGSVRYIGKKSTKVYFTLEASLIRSVGSGSITVNLNLLYKAVGTGSFVAVSRSPAKGKVDSVDTVTISKPAILLNVNPGDEFAIGLYQDSGSNTFTINSASIIIA